MNTSVPLGTEFGEQSAPPRLYVPAISGVAVATKSISPGVRVVGVQTESCPSVIRSLEQKHPVMVEATPTIADGIAVGKPGDLNLAIIRDWVDEIVAVDEETIAGAILSLLDKANILHIFHDRLNLQNPIQVSRVTLNLETKGQDHAQEVITTLREAGYKVHPIS